MSQQWYVDFVLWWRRRWAWLGYFDGDGGVVALLMAVCGDEGEGVGAGEGGVGGVGDLISGLLQRPVGWRSGDLVGQGAVVFIYRCEVDLDGLVCCADLDVLGECDGWDFSRKIEADEDGVVIGGAVGIRRVEQVVLGGEVVREKIGFVGVDVPDGCASDALG